MADDHHQAWSRPNAGVASFFQGQQKLTSSLSVSPVWPGGLPKL
ncbi:hypothetical protein ABZV58_31235 [Nocardia sp. NPDC004654]